MEQGWRSSMHQLCTLQPRAATLSSSRPRLKPLQKSASCPDAQISRCCRKQLTSCGVLAHLFRHMTVNLPTVDYPTCLPYHARPSIHPAALSSPSLKCCILASSPPPTEPTCRPIVSSNMLRGRSAPSFSRPSRRARSRPLCTAA